MINGWGRYGIYKTKIYTPKTISNIAKKLKKPSLDTFICRGLGRSYGDSSINNKIINLSNIKKKFKISKKKMKLNVQVIFQLKNFYLFY